MYKNGWTASTSDISKKVVEHMALGVMKKTEKDNWILKHSIVRINAIKWIDLSRVGHEIGHKYMNTWKTLEK